MVCLMEELVAGAVTGHVILLFSRAEEVGFAGVLAICQNSWIPKGSRVIGLEMSKPAGGASQGRGPIVRVGDRTGLFSPGLTHFLTQAAGFVSDDDPLFTFQRVLMDGGMCSTTALVAWGYDAAAICLALSGYHNMAEAGNEIVSESIDLHDFTGMVRILVEAVKRSANYKPAFREVRERLAKMHQDEHLPLLYDTAARGTSKG